MPIQVIFRGRVEDRILTLDDPPSFRKQVSQFEGKRIELTLKIERKDRSLPQNAYFHGVIVPIMAEACGNEEDDMKEILKYRFLRVDVDGENPYVKPTHKLSTVEFSKFVEQCWQLGAELGIVIPAPGEVNID